MNDPTLSPDDPRLTAYALGELSGDERAHVEAVLREDPGLRAAVEEIRAAAKQIEAALSAEADEEAASVEATWTGASTTRFEAAEEEANYDFAYDRPRRGEGNILRFPQLYVIVAAAAAACFAIFVYLRNDELTSRQHLADALARIEQKKRLAQAELPSPKATEAVAVIPPTPVEVSPVPAETTPVAPEMPKPADGGNGAIVTTVEPPPSVTEPVAAPDSKLTLLEITKPENALAVGDTLGAAPANPGAGLAGAPLYGTSAPGPTFGARAASSTTTRSSPSLPPGKATDPRTTLPTGPVVAQSSSDGAQPAFGPASPAASPSDDVVRLDAFEVSADRIGKFLNSGALLSFNTLTRGIPEQLPLPRAPRGASFGRARDVVAFTAENDFVRAVDSPSSRFSIDVDSFSYANVRRMLEQGTRPPREAVHIEEMINYFPYDYTAPKSDQAFAVALEVASAPWAPENRLVRIGLKAREAAAVQRGPANFVFLVDVSPSMGGGNKLPLVRDSIRLLLEKLRPDDRVAIVAFGTKSLVVLRSTPASRSEEIRAAVATLKPAGVGEGAAGLQLAYREAVANFSRTGVNRVLLCTDGAFNPGGSGETEVLRLIDEEARVGIAMTVLEYGGVNERSTPLERLAQRANATCGYVDTLHDAEKQVAERLAGSLATVARDVKVQVDFNPAKVLAYRLIGYENRPLLREEYSEDVAAVGEMGAGQAVTALYEIVPALASDTAKIMAKSDYTKYGAVGAVSSRLEMPDEARPPGNELLTVNVRYKNPGSTFGWPRTQAVAVIDGGTQFAQASADFRFVAAVAEFGMILRGSSHRGTGSMRDVVAWADSATTSANDPRGYRRDFIALARKANSLLR